MQNKNLNSTVYKMINKMHHFFTIIKENFMKMKFTILNLT